MGRCGLTERQAALTSWHEYNLRVKGKEKEMQERWTLVRWQMWQHMLLSPNIKASNKPKTPQAFCRFAWEQEAESEVIEKAKQYRVTEAEKTELNRIISEWESKK